MIGEDVALGRRGRRAERPVPGWAIGGGSNMLDLPNHPGKVGGHVGVNMMVKMSRVKNIGTACGGLRHRFGASWVPLARSADRPTLVIERGCWTGTTPISGRIGAIDGARSKAQRGQDVLSVDST